MLTPPVFIWRFSVMLKLQVPTPDKDEGGYFDVEWMKSVDTNWNEVGEELCEIRNAGEAFWQTFSYSTSTFTVTGNCHCIQILFLIRIESMDANIDAEDNFLRINPEYYNILEGEDSGIFFITFICNP